MRILRSRLVRRLLPWVAGFALTNACLAPEFRLASGSGGSDPTGAGGEDGVDGQGGLGGEASGGSGGTPPGGGGTAGDGGMGSGGEPETGGAGGSGGGSGGDGSGGSAGGGVVPGTAGYDCAPASGTIPALQATPVVSTGLTDPLLVTHEPNGDPERLFILEREGRIRIFENGVLLSTPFLDFSSKVSPGTGETGALGMAFHPNYESNGLFYVHYNDVNTADADSILEEYRVLVDPNLADIGSARLVLRAVQPGNGLNHKGGAINFGADGLLYWGLGDGGGSGDPDKNSQNLDSLMGKILRIDPVEVGANPYSSPADNLTGGLPELWDYGLRNPFRFSFDACTGDLYLADVGQNTREEINVENAGEGRKNYGWDVTEGLLCFEPSSGCDETGVTPPVLDYPHADGTSVTGGAVYRGSAIPSLLGRYFYADYGANKVWSITYDRDNETASAPLSHTQDLNNMTQIVSITNGADGELYFVSLSDGVFKLESAE